MSNYLSRARTRRVYTAETRSAYLARFHQSGLSQTEFCRRERIHISTFSLWRRAAGAPIARAKPAFAEVHVVGPKSDPSSTVILRLPSGATVEVSSVTEATWQGFGLLLKALQP